MGQAGTLSAAACAGNVVAGLASDCPGKVNVPGNIEVPPLRFSAVQVTAVGQNANASLGALEPLPYPDRPCPNGSLGADAAAEVCGGKTAAGTTADGRERAPAGGALARDPDLRAMQLSSAQICARAQAYPPVFPCSDEPLSGSNRGLRNSAGDIFGTPNSRRGSAASSLVNRRTDRGSLLNRARSCSNGLPAAVASARICAGGDQAGIGGAVSSGITQTGDAPTSDMDLDGTEPPSAQAGTRPEKGPPALISVDKPSTSCDNGSSVALYKLLGSPKSRRSFTASNADKLLLAGAVNRGSQMRARVEKRAAESHFACAGRGSVKRVHEKGSVLNLRLMVMRVALTVGRSPTGCRVGSPHASANSEHRDWCNNHVDSSKMRPINPSALWREEKLW
ncbi:hypothetical protein HPB48_013686 [Haemaphysalis longicornis]|uniref:Uncharacterized protein n=1 Tax=Haemaphysalis longicornis TaxID=44386 RepID=A0A9J6F914_HAELO|nr:hypothetical protein HPB48_013686 [Haemaphysalis longicornis]